MVRAARATEGYDSVTAGLRTRVRDEIIARLAIQPDLEGVKIDSGLPGKNIEREHVFVARIAGQRRVVFLQAGRKTIEDVFTITFIFWVANPGNDTLEADDRAEVMAMCLLDVLAEDPSLGDLEGLMSAVEAQAEGPDNELTDEGAVSIFRTDVECEARYLGSPS